MKHMKRKLCSVLSAVLLCALCVAPASALEYSIDGAEDYLFGRPTSDDTIYEWENPNVDRSKNTALIPPGFGLPTSYLPNSGEYLTPNLVPGALNGGLVNQVGSVGNQDGGTSADGSGSYPLPDTSISVDSSGFPTVSGGRGPFRERQHLEWKYRRRGPQQRCAQRLRQDPHAEIR